MAHFWKGEPGKAGRFMRSLNTPEFEGLANHYNVGAATPPVSVYCTIDADGTMREMTDDSTALGTQSVTTDSSADPITGVDTV